MRPDDPSVASGTRPAHRTAQPGAPGARRGGRGLWIGVTGALAGLAVACLATCAHLKFGSISAALSYVAGDRLVVDATIKSFGEAEPGATRSVAFELRNWSGRAVTLLGAKATCTCVVADTLPRRLAPAGACPLEVKLRTGWAIGEFSQNLVLYTDHPDQPTVHLRIIGRVVASKPRAIERTGGQGRRSGHKAGAASGLAQVFRFRRESASALTAPGIPAPVLAGWILATRIRIALPRSRPSAVAPTAAGNARQELVASAV